MTSSLELSDVATDARVVAERAVAEDGLSDITSELAQAQGLVAKGLLVFRSGGVVAGLPYADAVAQVCDCAPIAWQAKDGSLVLSGTTIGTMHGDLARMLRAERPLLNLLQRACGVATMTQSFVNAVAGTTCRILHTRKTAPGLRGLDVSAVLSGGGSLHRVDLGSQILFKDNHWGALAARGADLSDFVERARSRGVTSIYIEVETTSQVELAVSAGATRLLVDNQTPATLSNWCEIARGMNSDIEVEATGGIDLESVRDYAVAGADFVSVGALTHSVRSADVALDVDPK